MTREGVFVGLDLGTSSLKGVAVAGQAEQDPAAWRRALSRVIAQLAAEAPPSRWRAIGLSAMIPTLVLVDDAGRPTGPAITWEDSRAEAEGEALRASVGGDELYGETGQWVDGRYLLPMFSWLARHESSRAAPAARLLAAKDLLFWWLTGEYATDPSTASGFGCYRLAGGRWSAGVCHAAGLAERPALPAVLPSTAARPLTPAAAARLGLPAGIPVCLGAADSVLGARALGVERPGEVAYVTGTSTVVLGVSDRLILDDHHRFLVTPLAGNDRWGLEMDLLSTGSAAEWLASMLRLGRGGPARLMALAAGAPPGAGGVRFLPYMSLGEQAALWDPDLRGTLIGLSLGHGPAELARALVEGIVLETRRCLTVLDEAGLPAAAVRVAGDGGSSRLLRQELADATGREIVYVPGEELPYSAIGAAQVAALSQGFALPAPPQARGAQERLAPDGRRRSWWQERWEAHRELVAAVQSLYARRML